MRLIKLVFKFIQPKAQLLKFEKLVQFDGDIYENYRNQFKERVLEKPLINEDLSISSSKIEISELNPPRKTSLFSSIKIKNSIHQHQKEPKKDSNESEKSINSTPVNFGCDFFKEFSKNQKIKNEQEELKTIEQTKIIDLERLLNKNKIENIDLKFKINKFVQKCQSQKQRLIILISKVQLLLFKTDKIEAIELHVNNLNTKFVEFYKNVCHISSIKLKIDNTKLCLLQSNSESIIKDQNIKKMSQSSSNLKSVIYSKKHPWETSQKNNIINTINGFPLNLTDNIYRNSKDSYKNNKKQIINNSDEKVEEFLAGKTLLCERKGSEINNDNNSSRFYRKSSFSRCLDKNVPKKSELKYVNFLRRYTPDFFNKSLHWEKKNCMQTGKSETFKEIKKLHSNSQIYQTQKETSFFNENKDKCLIKNESVFIKKKLKVFNSEKTKKEDLKKSKEKVSEFMGKRSCTCNKSVNFNHLKFENKQKKANENDEKCEKELNKIFINGNKFEELKTSISFLINQIAACRKKIGFLETKNNSNETVKMNSKVQELILVLRSKVLKLEHEINLNGNKINSEEGILTEVKRVKIQEIARETLESGWNFGTSSLIARNFKFKKLF